MRTSIRSQIESNIWKTYALMAGFTAVIILMAYVFGVATESGTVWLWFGLGFAILSNIGTYFWGDKLVLLMSRARVAKREEFFDFYTVTENLCIASGLPKPKLYVIDDTAMNAFATGRDPDHAVICATTGILQYLDRRELEGVIAHELSHIKNYDIRLMVVVSILVGTVAFMADMFLRHLWWGGKSRDRDSDSRLEMVMLLLGIAMAIITPLLASIIQFSISRRREYLADASAADMTRYPEGLAKALTKISQDQEVLEAATNATAHLFIANPFKGKKFGAWFAGLFNTHPPIDDRIAKLRSM